MSHPDTLPRASSSRPPSRSEPAPRTTVIPSRPIASPGNREPHASAPGSSSDALMATFCHDLRSSLSAIVMGSDFLGRRIPDTMPEGSRQSRKMVEAIQRSARKMNRLLDDYHDLARLGGGRLSLEVSEVDVGALVRESARRGAADAPSEKGARVDVLAPEARTVLEGDLPQLARALAKLVQNALAVTPQDGLVVVSAEREPAGDAAEAVVIRVEDSGPGVAAEILPHLFDHEWLATQRARRGIGVGLAVARGIIEAHGGSLALERTGDKGSSFRVTLPLRAPRGG